MTIIKSNHAGLGGAGAPGGALASFYSTTIDNSLRLNAADSAHLTFAQSTATDISKWTVNFWLKRTNPLVASDDYDTVFGVDGPGNTAFTFLGGKIYLFVNYNTGGSQARLITNRIFRDPSSWYNFHVTFDAANSTAAQRLRLYVNGVEETSFSTDERSSITSSSSTGWNVSGLTAAINRRSGGVDSRYHNGYLAQFYNIDGAVVAPTSFAETKDGVWIPKAYSGSYGNNGWLLEFKQTGTGTASTSTVGADTSGNTNHWTSSGISAHDVVPDSPTNNFATINPLMIGDARVHSSAVYSEGNLKVACGGFSTSTIGGGYSTIAIPKDKKIYCEIVEPNRDANLWGAGVIIDNHVQASNQIAGNGAIAYYNRSVYLNGTENDYGSGGGALGGLGVSKLAAGDVLGIAVDGATGKVWFHRNGTYFGEPQGHQSGAGTTGNPSAGTNEIGTINNTNSINPSGEIFIFLTGNNTVDDLFINFGQDSTFGGNKSAGSETDANGEGLFQYAVPTDYVCLHSGNISDPTIGPGQSSQADDNFNTVLWTGNGASSHAITGTGHSPDFVWLKRRNGTGAHFLYDTVRGATKGIHSNLTDGETTYSDGLLSFDSDGFTVGDRGNHNDSSDTFVAWNWKGGGSASSNSDGSVTSQVSANTDAGFSIVTWTADADNGTVGHGLNSAPELILAKPLGSGTNWYVMHTPGGVVPANNVLNLDSTTAKFDPGVNHYNDTYPTSTVFSYGGYLGDDLSNDDKVAYCFHSVEGFSKIGSYVGNNSTDGPFVFTGHKPAFLLLKRIDSAASWLIYDNKRDTFNQMQYPLFPDLANAEYTSNLLHVDFLSNGFKIRNATYGETNVGTYIYWAIAEAPFKFANAR